MNPLAELAELRQRVDALEQELAARPPASSTLQPNVLTEVNGVIGADFTGLVNALGLILPAGVVGSPTPINTISWQRRSDGVMAAQIVGESGSAPETTRLALQALAPDAGDAVSLYLNGDKVVGGGANYALVTIGNLPGVVLYDDLGRSSFLQLLSTQKRRQWPQQGALLSIAAGATQSVVFNNAAWTLGTGDCAFFLPRCYFDQRAGGWLDHCSWSVNAITPTSMTIGVANLSGNVASGSIQMILETSAVA